MRLGHERPILSSGSSGGIGGNELDCRAFAIVYSKGGVDLHNWQYGI